MKKYARFIPLMLIAASWLTLLLRASAVAEASEPGRPNIVFFLADDMGWRDTSLYGSTFYETPHIERLAARGMTFSNAYAASPLCSPTRASILTGQYPGRLRLTTPAGHLPQVVLDPTLRERGPATQKALTPGTRTRLPNDYFTIAEALKPTGYTTGFFGKWHLGRDPYLPDNQGFDIVVGGRHHPGPPGGYFSPWPIDTIPQPTPGEHITDRLAEEAVAFLQDNRQRPFFLCFWDYSVHAPFEAKQTLIEKYREKADPNNSQRNPVMGAMIEPLDDAVGRLLDTLDEVGLAENTIIIFTSDNGGNMYNVVEDLPPTNNAPLRNGKGSIYEGGVRVPLIVVWPGHIEPGSTSDAIVTSVDYYPTILEMLGLGPNEAQVLDGVSIVSTLKQSEPLQREAVFCHFPHYIPATGNLPSTSVRQGDFKLIRYFADGPNQEDRLELYNLSTDIGETTNLAAAMPQRAAALNALITKHLADTQSLVPKPNPSYAKPTAGWQAGGTARLAIENGTLVVHSSGGDPYAFTSDVPAVSQPITVQFRLRSDSRGQGRVFFSQAKARGFQGHFIPFEPQHDGEWHDYEIRVPLSSKLEALRIDPSTALGKIEIDRIALKDAKGRIVRQWSFDQP